MASGFFLQASSAFRPAPIRLAAALAFFFLFVRAAAAEEEGGTLRQREIIRELESFRPSWAAADGVWMLERWDTDAGLDELVAPPSGRGDAAGNFRRLEDLYAAEAEELQRDGAQTRGVELLLEAAEMDACRLIPGHYPEFDSTEAKQPDFKVLRDYLQALLRRGDKAARAGDSRAAELCCRAALLCGRHLTRDRPSSIVFVTGLIFKLRGAQSYAGHLLRAGQSNKAAAVKRYADRLAETMRAFTWKANVALSEFAGFACLPAAARIARSDTEAFWRKEAVVRLATLRYGVPDEDGRTVERDLRAERLADDTLAAVADSDPDAGVRRLAVWAALNVTPKNYAAMEHRFR